MTRRRSLNVPAETADTTGYTAPLGGNRVRVTRVSGEQDAILSFGASFASPVDSPPPSVPRALPSLSPNTEHLAEVVRGEKERQYAAAARYVVPKKTPLSADAGQQCLAASRLGRLYDLRHVRLSPRQEAAARDPHRDYRHPYPGAPVLPGCGHGTGDAPRAYC